MENLPKAEAGVEAEVVKFLFILFLDSIWFISSINCV